MNEKTLRVSTGNGKISSSRKSALGLYRERIQGQRAFDLGCGGGRTSPWLHALASALSRRRLLGEDDRGLPCPLTGVRLQARRMPEILRRRWPTPASISCCSLTMASTPCRTRSGSQILAAVRRVLRDDGWFAFSSHSIEFRNIVVAFDRSGPSPRGTVAQSHVSAELPSGSSHQVDQRVCNLEQSSRWYEQLHYFNSRRNQVEQLRANGFVDIDYLEVGWTTRIGR